MTLTARTNPAQITGGASSVLGIRLVEGEAPVANRTVAIQVTDGHECLTTTTGTVTTTADGSARYVLTGTEHVERCRAQIRLIVPGETAEAQPLAEAGAAIVVHTGGPAVARIDGISAIALVVILSFAIDRIVRGLFFALAYIPAWARAFPDPEFDDVARPRRAEANRRLVYFVVSAALAMVAIGWFGDVRLLAALGFASVHPLLDVVVTGLVLTAGAERTDHILRSLGAGSAEPPAPKPTPIEITGRLTIDEQGKRTLGV